MVKPLVMTDQTDKPHRHQVPMAVDVSRALGHDDTEAPGDPVAWWADLLGEVRALQQCAPSAEEIEQWLTTHINPEAYEIGAVTMRSLDEFFHDAAPRIAALFAAQPTVEEVKAEGWERGYQAGASDTRDYYSELEHDHTRNPYRLEADHA